MLVGSWVHGLVDLLVREFREWAFVHLPQILQLCARALQMQWVLGLVDLLLWGFREWAFVHVPQILQLCARALERAPFPASLDDLYSLTTYEKYPLTSPLACRSVRTSDVAPL